MKRVLWRLSLAEGRRHPWLLLLSVLGVALGVTVVTAIDLANRSALRAFELSSTAIGGRATHQLLTPDGRLDARQWSVLERAGLCDEAGAPLPLAPVVEGWAEFGAPDSGLSLQVLGIEPLREAPFRSLAGAGPSAELASSLIAEAGSALLSSGASQRLGLELGEAFTLCAGPISKPFVLRGLLDSGDRQSQQALDALLVTDLSSAQELLGLEQSLSRIDLILPPGSAGELLEQRIRATLDPQVQLLRAGTRAGALEQLSAAFRLNLEALSWLALVVAMFLIHNTFSFSVVVRRPALGVLLALGTSRRALLALILGEALVIGMLGSALGLLLGWALAQVLLELVTRTINDLYFALEVSRPALDEWALLKGWCLGVGSTACAAWLPAREAASASALEVLRRSDLERAWRRALPKLAWLALGLLGTAGVLLAFERAPLAVSLLGMFACLGAGAAVAPGFAFLLAAALERPLGALLGVSGRLAARAVQSSLSRTALAIAALSVALATALAISVLVASFRASVLTWLDQYLSADVFVSAPVAPGGRYRSALDPLLLERLRALPQVASEVSYRHVWLGAGLDELHVALLDPAPQTKSSLQLVAGDPDQVWADFEAGAALLTEPLAWRLELEPGDTLALGGGSDAEQVRVAGICRDYSSDRGHVLLHARAHAGLAPDESGLAAGAPHTLGLYAAPGTSAAELLELVRNAQRGTRASGAQSYELLRAHSLAIFDRTFAITSLLRLLCAGVAFLGVIGALLSIELERAREHGLLRALGLSKRSTALLVLAQTGSMGLIAGLLAVPLGLLVAEVLIHAINRRAFGWSLSAFEASWGLLGATVGVGVGAALLAGLWPAWRVTRMQVVEALREDG